LFDKKRNLKIAFIGTRGIPACHGGFETCVEEIGWRLSSRGHQITVYSEKCNSGIKSYKGMSIVTVPHISIKGIDALIAAIFATIHALLFDRFDFYMVFDNAKAPVLVLLGLCRKSYAINTDGLGWQRDKWGKFAKKYYKWTEWASTKLCKNIVTDSNAMRDYYVEHYKTNSTVIEYGANVPTPLSPENDRKLLDNWGITPYKYFLQVTRFEPENNPLLSMQAFLASGLDYKIVVVGGARGRSSYEELMIAMAEKDHRILLPGFIYDDIQLSALWRNCLAYIHGNHIGGTNPALLQAMAAGRPIIARDCVFNREVLGEFGYFYERNVKSLSTNMCNLVQNLNIAELLAKKALERVRNYYNWNRITDLYENQFFKIIDNN
jgi:glycosyltransferase involved in cell wall biosynthesis